MEKALQQSFNPTLNTYNVTEFKRSLMDSKSSFAAWK
jgi:hypothetical protein